MCDVFCDIVEGHLYWALVSWTAETRNDLFCAAWDWRWAALLQADDITAETEAEITRIISGNLLS